MAHKHSVYDTDNHFIIDGVTRAVKNASQTKTMLVQNDHNSERFTFEIPRYIDGHDMSACNKVQVHYINIDSKTAKTEAQLVNKGVYTVDDLQISPESEDVVICSWLISQNATRLVGSLNFLIRFACVSDDDFIEYAWHTATHNNISVSSGINADETFEDDYLDIIEQWKESVLAELKADLTPIAEEIKADITDWKKTEAAEVRKEMTAFGDSWNATLDIERDRMDALIAMRNENGAVVANFEGNVFDYTVTTNGTMAHLEIKANNVRFTNSTATLEEVPAEYSPMATVRYRCPVSSLYVTVHPAEPGETHLKIDLTNDSGEIFALDSLSIHIEYALPYISVAELADIRVGLNGEKYDSAGTAVREQLKELQGLPGDSGGVADSITLQDRKTGKSYSVYVLYGKLMMEESEG